MAPYFEIEIDSTKKLLPDEEATELDRIDKDIEYSAFFKKYIQNNRPVIIKDIADDWSSIKHWTIDNKINFEFMTEKYGGSRMTIYECEKPHYNSQTTVVSRFAKYVKNWEKAKEKSLYLKDWHLQNQFPDDKFYEIPKFFASDWLNEYLTETRHDDYRFVYVGPAGTWTPFHADVFNSYSWSTNICGQKRWMIFPPGEELKLKDSLGNLPYDVRKCSLEDCRYFEIQQYQSEAVFVPSGWYHQVWNVEDTISINHNWVNGCNILKMWKSLKSSLRDVEKEIEDCQDMEDFEGHCQLMLKATFGMDFKGFYKFLHHIAAKRIDFICDNIPVVIFGSYTVGMRHSIFDLSRIMDVLRLFRIHPARTTYPDCQFSLEELTKTIQECLDIYSSNI